MQITRLARANDTRAMSRYSISACAYFASLVRYTPLLAIFFEIARFEDEKKKKKWSRHFRFHTFFIARKRDTCAINGARYFIRPESRHLKREAETETPSIGTGLHTPFCVHGRSRRRIHFLFVSLSLQSGNKRRIKAEKRIERIKVGGRRIEYWNYVNR